MQKYISKEDVKQEILSLTNEECKELLEYCMTIKANREPKNEK